MSGNDHGATPQLTTVSDGGDGDPGARSAAGLEGASRHEDADETSPAIQGRTRTTLDRLGQACHDLRSSTTKP